MTSLKLKKGKPSIKQVTCAEDLVAAIKYADWDYRLNNNVYMVFPQPRPGDETPESVTFAVTAGDFRAFQNARARLRRVGLFDAVDAKFAAEDTAAKQRTVTDRAYAEQAIADIDAAGVTEPDDEEDAMARRSLMALIERCRAVSWPVKLVGASSTNYLVTPPDARRSITINLDNGDRVYPETVLTQLTRAGLLEAEQDQGITAGSSKQAASAPVDLSQEGRGPVPGGYDKIGAVEVAEWSYSKSPFGTRDNKAVEMLLEDGSLVFGCIVGDFTGPSYRAVAMHRSTTHPELLSPAARARHAAKAKAKLENTADAPDPDSDLEDDMDADVLPFKATPPAALFQAPPAAAPSTPNQRLASILGGQRSAPAAPAFAPPAPAAATPVTPPPAAPAPTPAPKPVAEPVAEPAVAEPGIEPVQDKPARVMLTPPVARVQMASVAAALPVKPATPAAGPGGGLSLPEMAARLQKLSSAAAQLEVLRRENETLRRENERLARKVAEAEADVDKFRRQGSALAEQCIQKDGAIRRLRAQAEQDLAKVQAAEQLQTLLSGLMGNTDGGSSSVA